MAGEFMTIDKRLLNVTGPERLEQLAVWKVGTRRPSGYSKRCQCSNGVVPKLLLATSDGP